jgi:hypothetical protein
LQHSFAAVAEARRFYGYSSEGTAQFVYYQGSQRFAFDVFCDDQERFAALYHLLQHRQDLLDVGDFLVGDQDVRIFRTASILSVSVIMYGEA